MTNLVTLTVKKDGNTFYRVVFNNEGADNKAKMAHLIIDLVKALNSQMLRQSPTPTRKG